MTKAVSSYLAIERFHEDPEHSFTLPGKYYFDESIYTHECGAIFHRSWQYVCHISRLAEPGQYVVREIGDQSVVVLRDDDGNLRSFHNVCQHRAHRLLEGEGNLKQAITCPYHAWRYGLDGQLQFARGSERLKHFPKDQICLSSVRLDTMASFVFVNLEPNCAPMAEVYPGLEADILALSQTPEKLKRANTHDYPLAANWKNSVENYSECYHCPNRHPSLVGQALELSTYRIVTHTNWHRHHTRSKGDAQGYTLNDNSETDHEFGSWLVWPNLSIEVYPGGNLTIFHHIPEGPEATRQTTEWYFGSDTPTAEEQAVIDFVHIVREEDIPICENVQRGLHSLGYTHGKLVVDPERTDLSEHAVHDFQRMVARALNA